MHAGTYLTSSGRGTHQAFSHFTCKYHARQNERWHWRSILTWCLWQSITTITWIVVGRIKAVNIKCSTVSHADVFWMIAAIIEKLWHTLRKTDFSLHNSLRHCWMHTIEPAGWVCAAGIHLWTRLCHLCSSSSTKSIPTRQLGIGEVTKASVCIRHCSVRFFEKYVVGAFYKRIKKKGHGWFLILKIWV